MAATPAIMIGLAAASAAAGIATTVISGQQQAKQARQEQQTLNTNAQIEERNAYAEREQQQSADAQNFEANNQKLGQMRALYGASGIMINTGSPMDVLQGNAQQMGYQTAWNDYGEDLKQEGYSEQAQNLQAQANAEGQQAKYDTGAGMGLGIAGSIIGSASSFAGSPTGSSILSKL